MNEVASSHSVSAALSSALSNMRKTIRPLALVLGFVALHSTQLLADVIITEPVGGNDVSADKCFNSTNGAAFTALGNIVLAEAATTDFAVGNSQTLILTLPDGWRFNTAAAASVSFLNSRDLTAASIAVATSSLTVTFSVAGTGKFDQLTISGLQVQALDGSLDWMNTGYILNL